MKVVFFLSIFFTFNSIVIGQIEEKDSTLNVIFVEDTIPVPCDCEICEGIDPEFPGGEEALFDYVKSHSNFTLEMLELGLSGVVYVQFVIETDGSISQIKVLKGLHDLYDKKAIEIISNMPKWLPGKDGCGKLIRVRYNIPIKFEVH